MAAIASSLTSNLLTRQEVNVRLVSLVLESARGAVMHESAVTQSAWQGQPLEYIPEEAQKEKDHLDQGPPKDDKGSAGIPFENHVGYELVVQQVQLCRAWAILSDGKKHGRNRTYSTLYLLPQSKCGCTLHVSTQSWRTNIQNRLLEIVQIL